MTLGANSSSADSLEIGKAGRSEPLMFRSLQESVGTSVVLEHASLQAEASAVDAFDSEIALRAAYEEGRHEGMAAAAQSLQEQIQAGREAVGRFAAQFEEEKQRYFSEVEQEVVKLSLAIAERVLRRESEMDPTLLAAAARVALEQVADSSEAVLRVSVDEVDRWSEAFSPATKGMVIEADKEMPRGECLLKTRSGTVQLGVRAQLQEIERGFFELLGRRPAMPVASC